MDTREEKVNIKTNDGKIIGILHSPEVESNKAIILAHGITVDKDEGGIFENLANLLSRNNFTVLRFDFRGHGESDLDPIDFSLSTALEDLKHNFDFMKNKGYEKVGLLGPSFGGGTSTIFIGNNPNMIDALVLWNPLLDYESGFFNPEIPWAQKYFTKENFNKIETKGYFELGWRKFKIGKKLVDEMKKTEPWQYLENIKVPLLIIHGDEDDKVSYKDSEKYYKLSKGYHEVRILEGFKHGFHDPKQEKVVNKLTLDWFKRWLK